MTRIAIDGGQSALRLRVLPSGRIGEGPGYIHGPDALGRMLDAIRVAATEAELSGPVEIVALGLTGIHRPPVLLTRSRRTSVSCSMPTRSG
ncbi:hypothetical protein OHA18_15150 [Kribbella sp. NBC_00709]|uniref:hypothetical protein n=1 Tax=Kribbella sp. NBC_00709 TaxID=2975972 RepID=UPI002E298002|nr:hypothetical protein [Kribbella sp. NBC_00709]